MRSFKKSGITALTAGIALSIGAVPVMLTVPGLLAAAETSTVTPAGGTAPLLAGPRVVLATDSTSTAVVTQLSGVEGAAPVKTQTLTGTKKCGVTSSGDALLSLEGYVGSTATATASLSTGSIGVPEKTSGTSCAMVDSVGNEKLVITLADLTSPAKFPLLASEANLDVDLKQGARIIATPKLVRNGTVVDTLDPWELQSGSSVDGTANDTDIVACTLGADSGPDSGANDNCNWRITAPEGKYFNTLELVATAGSFSLEGGGDYGAAAAQNRTEFYLEEVTDGDLCLGSTATRAAAGTAPAVTVTRLNDAGSTGVAGCVPYYFTNGDSNARFIKDLSTNKKAQFVFDFTWTVNIKDKTPAPTLGATAATTALVPRTTVDYEVGTLPVSIAWCPDLVNVTVNGKPFQVVDDIDNNTDAKDQVDDTKLTGKQFACLISQESRAVNDATSDDKDTVIVKEQIYVYGDILMRK